MVMLIGAILCKCSQIRRDTWGSHFIFTLCNSFLAGEVSFLFHPKECIPYIIVTPCKLYLFEEEKPIVLKLEIQIVQKGQLHTHGDPYISMVQ